MLRRLQYVVGNFRYLCRLDAEYLAALQNLDELILVVDLTCQDAMHLQHQLDVVVGVELNRQLKMDYYQDAEGVELHQMRMDYYQDVAQQELALAHLDLQQLEFEFQPHLLLGAQHCSRQLRALVPPLEQLSQRQVRLLIQQLALD